MYKDYLNDIGTIVNIYILEKDIKVLMLIEPSKHTRLSNKTKRNFSEKFNNDQKPRNSLAIGGREFTIKNSWQYFDGNF